jgi:hypothetical protein
MSISTPITDIKDWQIERAFADVHSDKPFEETQHIRNLDFRCSILYTKDEAVALMQRYCPSYNSFTPESLYHLPDDCHIRIAREGSPAVYVETTKALSDNLMSMMDADEFDLYQTIAKRFPLLYVYRIWWD